MRFPVSVTLRGIKFVVDSWEDLDEIVIRYADPPLTPPGRVYASDYEAREAGRKVIQEHLDLIRRLGAK